MILHPFTSIIYINMYSDMLAELKGDNAAIEDLAKEMNLKSALKSKLKIIIKKIPSNTMPVCLYSCNTLSGSFHIYI